MCDESVSAFFETILTHTPSSPEKDYRELCESWRKATGADWIWLWLIHDTGPAFIATQLVARSRAGRIPTRTYVTNSKSVSVYCSRTGEIEVVEEEFERWKRSVGADVYSVGMPAELRSMGCRQFICVPLNMPGLAQKRRQRPPAHMPVICGVVCVHYKKVRILTGRTLHLLRRMGQLSAQALLNSYQALQRNILIELDQIAHQYLTDRSRDRELLCHQYAEAVIALIRQHLQVKGVSIFYRDSLRGGVQCLATTGLQWADGGNVTNPSEVHYAPGEGRTGHCYSTGSPLVLVDETDFRKRPKTIELIDGNQQMALPATLIPIPAPKTSSRMRGEPVALGVIRCKFHHSDLINGVGLCFDSIELQTLAFIAQQVAPVLETMELNIARERVVSVTKHDLSAPIGTIRHKSLGLRVNKNLRLEGDYIAVNRYDIYDIGVCTMMCLNLVAQLDIDPYSFIPNAKPEQVSIEGRIIAPLKNMLAHYAKEQNLMSIRFDGFERFPELWLDAGLMQRVIFNLITNAVKYGNEGSEVRLAGEIGFDGYYVDVENQGPGVEEDEADIIFAPRFRSLRTKSLAFGLGLGLPIARACAEKCGCSLTLYRCKSPTIFRLRVPRHLADSQPHRM